MTFLYLLTLIPTVAAWGGDGHRIVADLALQLVTDRAASYVAKHLGSVSEKTISRASVWADLEETKTTEYPGSGAFHFANTIYRNCQPFQYDRDCGYGRNKGVCIVTGLSEAIETAMDITRSEHERADALKFVIHLMADVHQPLHTGFKQDKGGRLVRLGQPIDSNLHDVWDTKILEELAKHTLPRGVSASWKSVSNMFRIDLDRRYEGEIVPHNISSTQSLYEYTSHLVTDTIMRTTCRFGYTDESGDRYIEVGDQLTAEFYSSRFHVVRQQLELAAVRLAALLDIMSAEFHSRRTEAKAAAAVTRANRLFEEKVREAEMRAANPESFATENPFAIFSFDIDPNMDSSSDIARGFQPTAPRSLLARGGVGSSPKKGKSGKAAKAAAVDDEELLDSAISSNQGIASFFFDGVDLSQVVLWRKRGRLYVTRSEFARSTSEVPTGTISRSLVSGSGDSVKGIEYLFDLRLFQSRRGSDMTDEFVLRCALKFAGIDPRLDLDDYMNGDLGSVLSSVSGAGGGAGGSGGPSIAVVSTRITPELMTLKAAHQERYKLLDERIARGEIIYTISSQMAFARGQIIFVSFGSTNAYFLENTLRTSDDWMRMNVIRTHDPRLKVVRDLTESLQTTLVDPEIFDHTFEDQIDMARFLRLLEKSLMPPSRAREAIARFRPSLYEEIEGADYYSYYRLRAAKGIKIDFSGPSRRRIEECFEYFHSSGFMQTFEWRRHN